MKKINKSSTANALTHYAHNCRNDSWEHFRGFNHGNDYKTVRRLMLLEQGGLCAYCEKKIDDLAPYLQRVEHFHPKSDISNPSVNWALNWKNVFVVCIGGEADGSKHPLPANLSCDAFKGHLISKGKLSENCEGFLLNPLDINSPICLFELDYATGELKPSKQACSESNYSGPNTYAQFSELVEETINNLNLNCQRLCDDRLMVLKHYNQKIVNARKTHNTKIFEQLAQQWLQKPWSSFFTTKRILLKEHAEYYLQSIGYAG